MIFQLEVDNSFNIYFKGRPGIYIIESHSIREAITIFSEVIYK